MPEPLRDIPRPGGSTAKQTARVARTRSNSPDQVFQDFSDDPADPAYQAETWSPWSWVASKAEAAYNQLQNAGAKIIEQVTNEAVDVGSTIYAAATGEPPAAPGPIFQMAAGAAQAITRAAPEAYQRFAKRETESNIAGYITLPDGRQIPVPKAQSSYDQGEKALNATLNAALRKADLEAASARAKSQIEAQKLRATSEQWARSFELTQRKAAQEAQLADLQIQATQLALDRLKPTQRELQYWWETPATKATEPVTRTARAIGPGVRGGIIQTAY